jgi:hypothetical protein
MRALLNSRATAQSLHPKVSSREPRVDADICEDRSTMDPLRPDPRFKELLRRMRFPAE